MATLKKIDKASPEGVENNLNIFDLPPSNVAINKSSVRELLPLSAVNDLGPYVFRLFPDNQFVDLGQTWLYLMTSIERKSGGNWVPITNTNESDKHICVIQNFGHSFVKTLKISINGVECFDSGNLYAYRAYIQHELGYSHEVRRGLHEANCYYIDDVPQEHYSGKGFTSRVERHSNGKKCETLVKLNFDLARQENLILNNSDIIFNIHRNSDAFLLLAPKYAVEGEKDQDGKKVKTLTWSENNEEYKIKVHDIRLFVKCVDVVQSLNNAISKQLEITPAKYAMRKVEMRSVFLSEGRTEISHNVFNSIIPRRMIIAFVANSRYSGDIKTSPFTFEPINIRTISAEASGNTYPASPYVFDFKNNKFMRAFTDMYVGLGLDDGDRTISINITRFLNGWCFFVIPMTSTLEDTPGFELIKNGTTCIKAQFSEPIKEGGYDMIVLGEFDSILSINSDRVLSTDGSI